MPAPLLIARAAAAAESLAVRAGASRAVARIAASEAAGAAARPRPGVFERLRGVGWDLQSWSELLSKVLPSVVHKITVKARGGPEANPDATVHLALATTFGLIPFTPRVAATTGMSVTINHTTNEVMVEFGYQATTTLELAWKSLRAIKEGFEESVQSVQSGSAKIRSNDPQKVKEGADEIVEGVAPWLFPLPWLLYKKYVRKEQPPNWDANPAIKNTNPTAPPAAANNGVQQNKAGQENEKRKKAIEEIQDKAGLLSSAMGTMCVFRLGRNRIIGGRPPGIFDSAGPNFRSEPFKDMIGEVILTREAAANPSPPAMFGFDLRTLVAQVLHDPGVRPPLPKTDQGPPVVENEYD